MQAEVANTKPLRVAVVDDYQGFGSAYEGWSRLRSAATVVCFRDHVESEDELVARLEEFDAVVVMRERTALPATVLSRLKRLKLIVTSGMVNAVVDIEAAQRQGIVVCGTDGGNGLATTAELAWGLILAAARGIPREDALVRTGGWQLAIPTGVYGRTLGIVGLGKIGKLMVPIGRAFGMKVVAWSRNLTPELAAAEGVELLDRETFFRSADVVTVHMKFSPRSAGYVGRDDLRMMKPTAHLVNTSRGEVVDEDALLDALAEGWIASGALDVFSFEPLPRTHPFRSTPNLILSPHMGYVTAETYAIFFEQYVQAIEGFLVGTPVRELALPVAVR